MSTLRSALGLSFLALVGGSCAVHVEGERGERERALEAGRAFEEDLTPPPLPEQPGPEDYLRTAFHANAGLRQRYWEWRAALERIPEAASPPNPALTFSFLFSDQSMKAWDRTTLGLANDPMTNIRPPNKLAAAGQQALEEARAAGLRFEAEKFRLQGEVLALYLDLAFHAQQIRAQEERIALLALAAGEAGAALEAGRMSSAQLIEKETELDAARNELANLHAQLPALVARMNTLLARPPGVFVPLPESLPEPRALPASDEEILRLAAERSPELAALASEVAGHADALELARLARVPDFGLSFNLMGSVSQSVGGMLILPLRAEAIRAGIEGARAGLRAADAAREQYARDLAASFVLDLEVLRNAERQAELFETTFLPRAELLVENAQASYAAGQAELSTVVEAELTRLDAELARAQLRTEREKALVAIEIWSALDVEALHSVGLGMPGMR